MISYTKLKIVTLLASNEPVQADFSDLFLQNMKSDPFIFASKESIDSAVNFNSTANKEVANRYTVLLKKMDEAKQK